MNPPLAMTVPRTATKDIDLEGVYISKGTQIIVDVSMKPN